MDAAAMYTYNNYTYQSPNMESDGDDDEQEEAVVNDETLQHGEEKMSHKQKLEDQWHRTYQLLIQYKEEVSGLLLIISFMSHIKIHHYL